MLNSPPRIYISAMETEVVGLPRFDSQADELLAKLSVAGYDIVWEKQWLGYDVIEQNIAASNALVAIVDENWTGSTWMFVELYYANGTCRSGMTSNPLMAPIPVFIYPVVANLHRNLLSLEGPQILPRSVSEAVKQIERKLPVPD